MLDTSAKGSFFLKSEKILLVLYWACSFALLAFLLNNHYQLISSATPIDYNEAAMPTITATIASGENPYSIENQPARASVYPPLYNIIVAPLSFIFGNTLELHRIVVAIFIGLSCLLCFAATLKASNSPVDSLAAATLFYAALLFYSTPIASPNSLGLFFFLACILIPWMYNFSSHSLAAALLLGVLAFYGKQYFVACIGYVSLYLFIAVSKKKALVFGTLSLLTLIASLVVVDATSPYFLDNTVFSVRTAVGSISSNKIMLDQMVFFVWSYLSLIILAIFLMGFQLYRRLYNNENNGEQKQAQICPLPTVDLTNPDNPLLSRKPDYFWFCFACSVSIIAVSLGKNPGNYMTYLFQLMSPFFLAATFTLFARSRKLKWLQLPLILFSMYHSYDILPKDFSIDQEGWDRLEKIMAGGEEIYASPLLLAIIQRDGKRIYQNGHTIYFSIANSKPDFFRKKDDQQTINAVWDKHIRTIYRQIEAKKFDFVILDRWTQIPNPPRGSALPPDGMAYLKKYYRLRETIKLSLPDRPGGGTYNMNVWEPK